MEALRYESTIRSFADYEGFHYLDVSRANVRKLGGKFLVRLVCSLEAPSAFRPRRCVKFHCGLMSHGDGTGYISLARKRMQELGLDRGRKVRVKLELDTSPYGLEMPEELAEALRQDDEGRRRFEGLTKGKQRNILHFVSNRKSSDKRIERAIQVLRNLQALPEGRETVRGLLGGSGKFNRQS